MKKIPTSAVVACLVVVILLMVFVLVRSANHGSGGDAGDVKAVAAEVIKSSPKGDLPPGANPTEGAMGMGGGRGKK